MILLTVPIPIAILLTAGETIDGEITLSNYDSGTDAVIIQLTSEYSLDAAELYIGHWNGRSGGGGGLLSDPEVVYCAGSDITAGGTIPFSVTALEGETSIKFTITHWKSASDPNHPIYKSESSVSVKVKPNEGSDCCRETPSLGNVSAGKASQSIMAGPGNEPQVWVHTHDGSEELEVLLPGYNESYIMTNPSCGFLGNWSISKTGSQVRLTNRDDGRTYICQSGSPYRVMSIEDSEGNPLVYYEYSLDDNRYPLYQRDADFPNDYYIAYTPNGTTGTIDSLVAHAGGDSRTYTIDYDGSGNATGMTDSSCGCSASGVYYGFDSNGEIIFEYDSSNTVIYEYVRDAESRIIEKWIGAKSSNVPMQKTVYNEQSNGSLIVDIKDYVNSSEYKVTREYRTDSGFVNKRIKFEELNADPDTASGFEECFYRDIDIFIPYDPNGPPPSSTVWPEDPNLIVVSPKGSSDGRGIRKEYSIEEDTGKVIQERWYDSNGDYIVISSSTYDYIYEDGKIVDSRQAVSIDARGAETVFNYNDSDDVVPASTESISDDLIISRQFHYDNLDRVTMEATHWSNGIEDVNVVYTSYDYDSFGNLRESYNQGIVYDPNKALSDPYGITRTIHNGFGQVKWQIDPDGVVSGKTYDAGGMLESDIVLAAPNLENDPNLENVNFTTDYLTSQIRYGYDSDGRLEYVHKVKSDDAFIYGDPNDENDTNYWITTKYEYDLRGNRQTVIEGYYVDQQQVEHGLITSYEYNNQNEVVRVTLPTGKWTKTIYNGRGMAKKTIEGYTDQDDVDQDVLVTEFEYDANGNLLKQINPDKTVSYFEYDDFDRLKKSRQLKSSDPNILYGPYTVYEYNNAGDVKKQSSYSADGILLAETINEYDDFGRVRSQRVLEIPGVINDSNDMITLYEQDYSGNILKTIRKAEGSTEPNGIETNDVVLENAYDFLGRLDWSKDGEGNKTSYTYTEAGRELTTKFADNSEQAKGYDSSGRMTFTIDAEGDYTELLIDSLGRVTRQTVYDCNDTPSVLTDDYAVSQTRFIYDDFGNIVQEAVMKNPASNLAADTAVDMVTDYVFDSVTGLLYSETGYYNGSGSTQATTYHYYDGIGRKWKTVDPELNETKVYFDPANNAQVERIESVETDKNDSFNSYTVTQKFTYDDYGRKYTSTLDRSTELDLTTTYVYDGLGRLEYETAPDDVATKYVYNGFGNLASMIEDYDPNGAPALNRITDYKFNRLGQQVEITGYDTTPQTTVYTYDGNDSILSITYPDSNSISYVYDQRGNLEQETQRNGQIIYYGYDFVGSLLWESQDSLGNPLNADFHSAFTYDATGQVINSKKYVNGSVTAGSAFAYNGFGLADSETSTLYSLDPVTTSYTFDQSGNTLIRTHGSEVISYTYDGLGRIASIDRGNDDIVEYAYVGRNTKAIDYPEAEVKEQRFYDDVGRVDQVTSFETFTGGSNILDLQYIYNLASNRTSVKYNHLAVPVWDKYGYDNLGRLTNVEYGSATAPLSLMDMQGDINFMAGVCYAWLDDESSFETCIKKEFQKVQSRNQVYLDFKRKHGLDSLIDIPETDMPLLTLSVYDDSEVEVITDDNGNTIAEIVFDSNDRIESFTVFLADGGMVVVDPLYDTNGSLTATITAEYDSNGDLIHSGKTSETILAAAAESASLSSASSDGFIAMSMGAPEAPASASDTYTYDLLGNRETAYINSGIATTFTYTHNGLNQYSGVQESIMGIQIDHPLDHDDNGNLSIDENGFTLDYDYRNRLVDVNGFASFDYDAFGRRIKKTVSGVITTYFYYDTAGRVAAEYESATTPELARTFVYGNEIDEVLAMFKHPDPVNTQGQLDDWNEFGEFTAAWLCIDPNDACYNAAYDDNSDSIINYQDYAAFASVWSFPDLTETRYYYLHDALGSVMGITGGKYDRAEDREFYLYTAYGEPDGISAAGNPYLFTGRRYDPETGLYYYRARYMSPSLGRFISFDPYGYIDSMNLYEYTKSNPVMFTDPRGLTLTGSGSLDVQIVQPIMDLWESVFGGKFDEKTEWHPSDNRIFGSSKPFLDVIVGSISSRISGNVAFDMEHIIAVIPPWGQVKAGFEIAGKCSKCCHTKVDKKGQEGIMFSGDIGAFAKIEVGSSVKFHKHKRGEMKGIGGNRYKPSSPKTGRFVGGQNKWQKGGSAGFAIEPFGVMPKCENKITGKIALEGYAKAGARFSVEAIVKVGHCKFDTGCSWDFKGSSLGINLNGQVGAVAGLKVSGGATGNIIIR